MDLLEPTPAKAIPVTVNDPSTPDLVATVPIPEPPAAPKFAVVGFTGLPGEKGTPERQAAEVFTTLAAAIGHAKEWSGKEFQRWAAVHQLVVMPRAGRQLNAFYDRQSLKFFWEQDPVTARRVYLADSADVVCHEFGHALLDVLRPDLWNAQSLEVQGFHESFGDMIAVLNVLSHDVVVGRVLEETGGELMKSNVVSRIGEEAAWVLAQMTRTPNQNCLRNAVNTFTYAPPEDLPGDAPDDQLSAECHSYSRLFTGAWYETLAEIYKKLAATLPPAEALAKARDDAARTLLLGVTLAPLNQKFYRGVANGLLIADRNLGLGHGPLISKVFSARKILPGAIKILAAPTVDASFRSEECGEFSLHRRGDSISLRIADKMVISQSEMNPLYGVEVEMPAEEFVVKEGGAVVDSIDFTMHKALRATKKCLDQIYLKGLVSREEDGKETPFVIENGKLVRRHVVCGCR